MSKYEPKLSIQWTPSHIDMIRRLIADLIGDRNRLHEMGNLQLEPEMLPESLEVEAMVLRAIYRLAKSNVAPTRDNIIVQIAPVYGEQAEKAVDALLMYASTNGNMIGVLSLALSDWISAQGLRKLSEELTKDLSNPKIGNVDQIYHRFVSQASRYAPRLISVESTPTELATERWVALQQQRRQKLENNEPLGPKFPWKALNEAIGGYIRMGDMIHFAGKSKTGKTLIAGLIAEYIAYELGYDVELFHMETETEQYVQRMISRHTRLPLSKIDSINFAVDPFKSQLEAVTGYIKAREESKGSLKYTFCPGISIDEIAMHVANSAAISRSRGREYVWIVDYYSLITPPPGFAGGHVNNYIADRLKTITQSARTRSIVFSQYSDDADFTQRLSSFDGQMILKRSQANIQIRRTPNNEKQDVPLLDEDGNPMRDGLGNPMYKQRRHHPLSFEADLYTATANSGSGGSCPVEVYADYCIIVEPGQLSVPAEPPF